MELSDGVVGQNGVDFSVPRRLGCLRQWFAGFDIDCPAWQNRFSFSEKG
jgi:hypothetical protein